MPVIQRCLICVTMRKVWKFFAETWRLSGLLRASFISYTMLLKWSVLSLHCWKEPTLPLVPLRNSPFFSSSFFRAASSRCFRMIASRARSAFAWSVFPAKCNFIYLSLACCLSISSLKKKVNNWDNCQYPQHLFPILGLYLQA